MTDPKQPIKLDYKTPEKGERITARTIISRVIFGFGGMLTLMLALGITASAGWSLIFERSEPSDESIPGAIIIVPFTLMAWFLSFYLLKYAFLGDRKSEKSSTEPEE